MPPQGPCSLAHPRKALGCRDVAEFSRLALEQEGRVVKIAMSWFLGEAVETQVLRASYVRRRCREGC